MRTTSGAVLIFLKKQIATFSHRKALFAILAGVCACSSMSASGAGWVQVGSLAAVRSSHSATLLNNGKVLICGGTQTGVATEGIASCELFDLQTMTVSPAPPMNQARAHHQAIKLPNGKVLVSGGSGPSGVAPGYFLSSCEIYDPESNTWSPGGDMNAASADHRLVLLDDNRILRVGGSTFYGYGATTCELYDPAQNAWTITGSLGVGRHTLGVAKLINGKVIAAGGYMFNSAVEVYDPSTESWSQPGNLTRSATGVSAISLKDGRALLMGGESWSGSHSHYRNVDVYDSATGALTPGQSMLIGRAYFEAVTLPDGDILAIGGACSNANYSTTAKCDRFDVSSWTWAAGPNLNEPRLNFTSVVAGGKVYVLGGIIVGGGRQTSLSSIEMLETGKPGDVDEDGLPDTWEMQNFGALTYGSDSDPDGDGVSNQQEFALGTNPKSFDIGPASIARGLQVSWRSVSGRTYQVQRSERAEGPWQNCGSPVAGTGHQLSYLDAGPTSACFYRVTLVP